MFTKLFHNVINTSIFLNFIKLLDRGGKDSDEKNNDEKSSDEKILNQVLGHSIKKEKQNPIMKIDQINCK